MRAFVIAGAFVAALAAQQPDPILAKLSSEATNVLVVRDPLPVLEKVLASPAAAQFLAGTAELQRRSFGRAFDAAGLRRQLSVFAPLIPVEIVIAAPTRTMDGLSHVAALLVCETVASALVREGLDDGKVVAAVRKTASEHLAHLDVLPLHAWVRTRDDRTAEGWFDSAAETLRKRADEAGLAVKIEGNRIEVRATPLAAGAPLGRKLEAAGFDLTKTPATEWSATIEQNGALLSLRIGTLAAAPCPEARLGDRWRDPGSFLFARSEVSDAKASFLPESRGILALGKLGDGHAGLAKQLAWFLDRVRDLCATQTVSLCDRGFTWTHSTGSLANVLVSIDTVPPQLLRLFAAGEPVYVTSDTLDVALLRLLQWIAEGELPATAPGRSLADFLADDASSVFATGVAVVTRPAKMRSMKGVTGPLPFVGVALVARPKTAADAAGFMAAVTRHVASMVHGTADVWRERDLGLGVATHALALDVVAPQLAQREIDWDFQPHWFVSDDLLFVSTDPALSKELLARARGATKPATDSLLQRLYLGGETLTAWSAAMQAWTPVVNAWRGDPADLRMAFFQGLHAMCSLVDSFEQRTELVDGALRSTVTLLLRNVK